MFNWEPGIALQEIEVPYVFDWEPGIALQEIEVPYVLDWEPGISLHAMHGNLASSCGKGKSHEFSRFAAGTCGIFSS